MEDVWTSDHILQEREKLSLVIVALKSQNLKNFCLQGFSLQYSVKFVEN